MTSISARLDDPIFAVIEALALNDHTGLTIPGIVTASSVPKSTVDRMIDRMESRGVLVRTGEKQRKAPVFRLNAADPEIQVIAAYAQRFVADVYERLHPEEMEKARELEISFGSSRRTYEVSVDANDLVWIDRPQRIAFAGATAA